MNLKTGGKKRGCPSGSVSGAYDPRDHEFEAQAGRRDYFKK